MTTETLKLGLIERLMKLPDEAALRKVEESIIRAEMESNAIASLNDIAQGEVMSIDEFKEENRKWARERYTR